MCPQRPEVGIVNHLYLSVTKHDVLFLPFKVERTKTPLESKIEEIPGQFLRSVALVGFNVVFNGDFKKMDSLWG